MDRAVATAHCPACGHTVPTSRPSPRPAVCGGLLSRVARAAPRIEEAGELPRDVLRDLEEHGCLSLAADPRYGGGGLALPELLRTLRRLARADASVAWNVMVWAQSHITMARLPIDTYDKVLGPGPAVPVSATSAGDGTVRGTSAGLTLTGSWRFASAVHHAQWLLLHCRVADGATERPSGVLVPRSAVTIEPDWQVLGLRGTGSDTVHAHDVPVTPGDLYALEGHLSAAATSHSLLPVRPSFALHTAAVALGTARGALDCLITPTPGTARGERALDPVRAYELGEVASRLDTALAGLKQQAHTAWRSVTRAPEPSASEIPAAMAASAVQAVRTAVDTALWCFQAAGSAALYDRSPVQRRLRDTLAIAQHANVRPSHFGVLGEAISGAPPGPGP